MNDETDLETRLAELRRAVYGTPGGHESAAADELAEVERALAELRADAATATRANAPTEPSAPAEPSAARSPSAATAVRRQPTESSAPSGTAPEGPAAPDASSTTRSRRSRRIAIAGIAVAVALAAAIAAGPLRDLLDPPRGLEVFERPQVESDMTLRGYQVALADRSETLRHVGSAVGHEVWVFRGGDDVCMIVQREHWSGWGANCVSESEFRARGIRQIITYDELSGGGRPAGLDPSGVVELEWDQGSTDVGWSIVPLSAVGVVRDRVWVPSFDVGAAPMTYEEWSAARLAARRGGS